MPELAALLDQLIETTPPADDPTGAATFDALNVLRLIRNIIDHQIVTHTAQLDERAVAHKAPTPLTTDASTSALISPKSSPCRGPGPSARPPRDRSRVTGR